MPATRSRTDHWRDCLRKVHERGGAIEISIARDTGGPAGERPAEGANGHDLVWRVRLLSVDEQEILVEPPAAFGASIDLRPGVALIGAMTIGQNRWMFHTRTLAARTVPGIDGRAGRCVALATPTSVERCTRRNFYRISTAGLSLPPVQCWPLIDPATVLPAETANRLAVERALGRAASGPGEAGPESILLPDVGPKFPARLLNVSGGGLGLRVDRADAGALDRRQFLWLRVDLTPDIPAPLAVTARLAHTHLDSEQNLYAGLAFDFAFNPAHREFVLALLGRYVETLMARQVAARAA